MEKLNPALTTGQGLNPSVFSKLPQNRSAQMRPGYSNMVRHDIQIPDAGRKAPQRPHGRHVTHRPLARRQACMNRLMVELGNHDVRDATDRRNLEKHMMVFRRLQAAEERSRALSNRVDHVYLEGEPRCHITSHGVSRARRAARLNGLRLAADLQAILSGRARPDEPTPHLPKHGFDDTYGLSLTGPISKRVAALVDDGPVRLPDQEAGKAKV